MTELTQSERAARPSEFEEIFSTGFVANLLANISAGEQDEVSNRAKIVEAIQGQVSKGRAEIERRFSRAPCNGRETLSLYSWLMDQTLSVVFEAVQKQLSDQMSSELGAAISLIAVGGYGREEMCPFSDVDLLFLSEHEMESAQKQFIEAFLYVLWDLHLKVGHASRDVDDCVNIARADMTVRTALLERRFLAGHSNPDRILDARLKSDVFPKSEQEFITAKLDERAARHAKQGGQRYLVEPNVKEAKGGLRDLQTLFWISKYVHEVQNVRQLVPAVFSEREFEHFDSAEEFLMAVRCHLHLIAGRAQDQLNFDLQVEVAARMGYHDADGRRAVEHFMQDYFRHATRVGELTRILLTALEAEHRKKKPSLVGFFQRRKRVRPDYVIKHNRISYKNKDEFLSSPLNFLKVFDEALRTGFLLHPDVMRSISANLNMVTEKARNDPIATKLFLHLLLKHGNPERVLRRMNELGLLSAFLPEFKPIVAMMQFNMYHHYTVDEHTIQCLKALARIENGEMVEDLPIASMILEAGINRAVLYMALLLHDIGKGRAEDHCVVGARIARQVAPRFGFSKADCETIEWLVRRHLLMSDTAQKRDLSDPRTVRDFARAVKTKKRLDLLLVLTVCDIRGVGPGTWNNWKAQLLRNLYHQSAEMLDSGLEEVNSEARESEAKSALRTALPDWSKNALRKETSRHYSAYWQGLPTSAHVVFANLLSGLVESDIRIDMMADQERDATRVCFAMHDHPGIFARLAGALALAGANVVDARSYTSKDGFVTAGFWVQDHDNHPFELSRFDKLKTIIEQTLKGHVVAKAALAPKDKIKKRERQFRVQTAINFDNIGAEIHTIIEVDTRDRPALLFDLASELHNNNIVISSAVIATYGAQVVDVFYVKDSFGLKLHSKTRQKRLEEKLLAVIKAGAGRASA